MAVDLSFSETGAGEPLVILHGLFGSKRNWASIARPSPPAAACSRSTCETTVKAPGTASTTTLRWPTTWPA